MERLTWHDGLIPDDEVWQKIGDEVKLQNAASACQHQPPQLTSEHNGVLCM